MAKSDDSALLPRLGNLNCRSQVKFDARAQDFAGRYVLHTIAMMTKDRLLREVLPYRMKAVDTLNVALRARMEWDRAPSMKMYFNDKLVIEGNSNGFTNAAIEAGVVHCRALLEFLGLTERDGKLVKRESRRRDDDIGIEDFSNASGPLLTVSPDQALSRYEGGRDAAEQALVTVIRIANKGIAHLTKGLSYTPDDVAHVEIASRGVPLLVVSYLYTPLGWPAPDYRNPSRPR